jgi:hypothetical protein
MNCLGLGNQQIFKDQFQLLDLRSTFSEALPKA